MATDYVKQIKALRARFDNREMPVEDIYHALRALEGEFAKTLRLKQIQCKEVGEFYSEYDSLSTDCAEELEERDPRGLIELLVGD